MLYYIKLLYNSIKNYIYNAFYYIYTRCKNILSLYIITIPIYYIAILIILTSTVCIYLLHQSTITLTIHDKTINTLYNTLLINHNSTSNNPPANIQDIPITKHKKKSYKVKGFTFSRAQILKIIEIHILKKLIIANATYDIQPITKNDNKKYILINFEMSLQCNFFQLIQLFETLEKFAITISDFSITPKSEGNSDVNISFTAPAYE